ncbi:protein-L-isoaspartate O-methyltransferase [Iodobacter ciconiae]|uniref:Protein-L-isoaspartate O-methyltransferase n=2 Tax=Iodobacter ciconiae TaxID=2496266 RepID=A0A3S8ZXN5_9NEIS|nr:protein-L-isoaspartate O-methyltransferase [Iodobacter ciconiae]
MDWENARYLLVEQQIRPWDVLDQKVLNRVLAVKREDFVPADKKELAFVDIELPLGNGTQMLAPKMEAKLLQDIDPQPSDKLLVVGAGTGYLMALAAGLVAHVYGVEIDAAQADTARANLAAAGIKNATVTQGDALAAAQVQGPFNAIIVTGSLVEVPALLKDQLAVGGRLIAVVGELPIMSATLVSCVDKGSFGFRKLFEYNLPRLKNVAEKTAFTF